MRNRKTKKYRVVEGQGQPCPRCGQPTQIRVHKEITDKQLRQPFYYVRWFNCTNRACKTTLIMPDHYKVFPAGSPEAREQQESRRIEMIKAQLRSED